MARFSHIAMLIELDCEPWWPKPVSFTHGATYLPRRSRTLLHESIHYWQQLSHGYLFGLAEEDWEQLLKWERTGEAAPAGPRRRDYVEPHGPHGFSASDLCESLARFWEVLLFGPGPLIRDGLDEAKKNGRRLERLERLEAEWKELAREQPLPDRAFDLAMNIAGGYGHPFAVVREILDPQVSLIFFPLLGHFALKTTRPVHFFESFLDELAAPLTELARELGLLDSPPRATAGVLYTHVEQQCEAIVRRAGDAGLVHAPDLLQRSALKENDAYAWSFERLAQLSRRVRGDVPLDSAICLPGIGEHRELLAAELTPPCVRFRDGATIGLARDFLESSGATTAALDHAQAAARASLAIQARWENLQAASRRY